MSRDLRRDHTSLGKDGRPVDAPPRAPVPPPVVGTAGAPEPKPASKVRRWARWAAIAGTVLALVCPALPHGYQKPCQAIASICTGVLP